MFNLSHSAGFCAGPLRDACTVRRRALGDASRPTAFYGYSGGIRHMRSDRFCSHGPEPIHRFSFELRYSFVVVDNGKSSPINCEVLSDSDSIVPWHRRVRLMREASRPWQILFSVAQPLPALPGSCSDLVCLTGNWIVMSTTEQIIDRIDDVLRQNRRIEWIYIGLTGILFCIGTACFIAALSTGHFAWSTPSAITTGLLYWPLREIKEMRNKNIALATAPMLITQLPPDKAAEEIQKLLQKLYGNSD